MYVLVEVFSHFCVTSSYSRTHTMKTQPTKSGTVQIQKGEMAGNFNPPNYTKYFSKFVCCFYHAYHPAQIAKCQFVLWLISDKQVWPFKTGKRVYIFVCRLHKTVMTLNKHSSDSYFSSLYKQAWLKLFPNYIFIPIRLYKCYSGNNNFSTWTSNTGKR